MSRHGKGLIISAVQCSGGVRGQDIVLCLEGDDEHLVWKEVSRAFCVSRVQGLEGFRAQIFLGFRVQRFWG